MSYSDRVKSLGPSAYFPCREQSGAVVDVMAGLSGAVTGCSRGGSALPGGKGLTMADSRTVGTDYVTVADHANIRATSSFSIECWTTFHTLLSGTDQVCWLNKGYTSHTAPYYEYGFFASPTSLGASTYAYDFNLDVGGSFTVVEVIGPQFVLDTPYHFVGTYDGATATIYVNGVGTSISVSGAAGAFATPLYFGRYANVGPTTGAPWHNGNISDVAVYHRALTSAEVLQNYKIGLREGVLAGGYG